MTLDTPLDTPVIPTAPNLRRYQPVSKRYLKHSFVTSCAPSHAGQLLLAHRRRGRLVLRRPVRNSELDWVTPRPLPDPSSRSENRPQQAALRAPISYLARSLHVSSTKTPGPIAMFRHGGFISPLPCSGAESGEGSGVRAVSTGINWIPKNAPRTGPKPSGPRTAASGCVHGLESSPSTPTSPSTTKIAGRLARLPRCRR